MFKGEVAQLEAWQAETTLTQESARSKARRGSWSAFEAQLAPAKPSFCGLHKHISKRGGSWLYKRVAQTVHSSGQQLCKRQWLPEKQHGWLSTSHRSDLPSPLLFLWRSIDFFTFPALHRLDLIFRLPFFTEMESATFDWSITFVERWIFRSPPQTHTHWHNTETRIECTNTTLVSSGKDLHCWRYGWYWWHCPYCCTAITYVCLWLSPPSLRPLLLFLPVSFFGDPPEVEEALRLKLLLSCHLMMDQPLDHLPTLLGPNTPLFFRNFSFAFWKRYIF